MKIKDLGQTLSFYTFFFFQLQKTFSVIKDTWKYGKQNFSLNLLGASVLASADMWLFHRLTFGSLFKDVRYSIQIQWLCLYLLDRSVRRPLIRLLYGAFEALTGQKSMSWDHLKQCVIETVQDFFNDAKSLLQGSARKDIEVASICALGLLSYEQSQQFANPFSRQASRVMETYGAFAFCCIPAIRDHFEVKQTLKR